MARLSGWAAAGWQALTRRGKGAAPDGVLGVAIIGGGFTGYAAALALVRNTDRPLEIAIFDGEASRAGGVAYGHCANHHILNVRAGDLSCEPDRPGDFVDWIIEHRSLAAPERQWLEPLFLPRSYISAYVRGRLLEALLEHRNARVWTHDQTVQTLERRDDAYRLHVGWRSWLDADAVILATGYGATRHHRGLDPFCQRNYQKAGKASSVAIIGSGLTMMDTWLSLRAAGYNGVINLYSRHGRLPEAHALDGAPKMPSFLQGEPDLRSIVRAVRQLVIRCQKEDIPWQSVIGSVRHDMQAIWVRLNDADRARFFRHVRPVWDRYRHRLPEQMLARLTTDLVDGGTVLTAARVHSVKKARRGWQVCMRPRGREDITTQVFDLVFDCTGHKPQLPPRLLKSLEAQGLAKADRFGLGVQVTASGNVIGTDGRAQTNLFALGPLGQGSLMEITAIPEIIVQAKACAMALTSRAKTREFALDGTARPSA